MRQRELLYISSVFFLNFEIIQYQVNVKDSMDMTTEKQCSAKVSYEVRGTVWNTVGKAVVRL